MLAALISVPHVHQASALPLSYTKAQFYSVYVPVHVHMCTGAHVCVCIHVQARRQPWVSFCRCHRLGFLRHCLTVLELAE